MPFGDPVLRDNVFDERTRQSSGNQLIGNGFVRSSERQTLQSKLLQDAGAHETPLSDQESISFKGKQRTDQEGA